MSLIDPEAARLLIGSPKPIPALLVSNEDDGKQYIVQRVAVMLIADDLIAKIAATCAHAVVIEVLGALEEVNVIPKGTRQKYEEPLQLNEDSSGLPKESPGEPTTPAETQTRIPEEP